jgi:hypothetical protein
MSIQALKLKGVINYGSNRSGKPPGGVWLTQGPLGSRMLKADAGPVGFSINGGRRNVGYVGQSMAMSKNGTPFYGQFARGSGGVAGKYPRGNETFNLPASRCVTQGEQANYIKPSVLSTKGMLEKKYKWIQNGQYPNNWVQPVYPTGTQEENASEWLYVQKKAAANITVNDTNNPCVYVGYRVRGGPTGCSTTNARRTAFGILSSSRGYTKTLGIPQDASQYTVQVQRKCSNPIGPLKPFPFATNSGTNNSSSDVHYTPPPVPQVYYLEPPEWYTSVPSSAPTTCYKGNASECLIDS